MAWLGLGSSCQTQSKALISCKNQGARLRSAGNPEVVGTMLWIASI